LKSTIILIVYLAMLLVTLHIKDDP